MGYSIEDFEIISEIGAGTFARVFLVRNRNESDANFNKLYALKSIAKQSLVLNDRIQDVFTERSVLCKTSKCPFLAKMHSAFHDTGRLYFLMDYYECGDLHTYLNTKKKLRTEHARHLAAEVLVALRTLHKEGIMYRDLKPENILLCTQGHAHLSDFGLSKLFEDRDDAEFRTSSVVGSPLYIAPEVLRKEAYTTAVDYWAFGILLYRMLSGVVPFTGASQAALFDKITNGDLKFSSATLWDIQAKDLITKLLNKTPQKRLIGDDVMNHPFFRGLDWTNLGITSPPEFSRTRSMSRPVSQIELDDMDSPVEHDGPQDGGEEAFGGGQGGYDRRSRDEDLFAGFSYEGHSPLRNVASPS
eukprot:PhF_6_TR1401/c0_g1_i1/m.2431/K13303/SGK2; serum/glucocorticoid-regulated kinase 2